MSLCATQLKTPSNEVHLKCTFIEGVFMPVEQQFESYLTGIS